MNDAPSKKKILKIRKGLNVYCKVAAETNSKLCCFFPFILSFKGGVSSYVFSLRSQPTPNPSPWGPSGRFRGVLVPTTSGETLIDFMVNGESILGSPCLGQCWLVEVGWGIRGCWYVMVSYRELEFVVGCLDGFCVFFWSELLFFVLILFF